MNEKVGHCAFRLDGDISFSSIRSCGRTLPLLYWTKERKSRHHDPTAQTTATEKSSEYLPTRGPSHKEGIQPMTKRKDTCRALLWMGPTESCAPDKLDFLAIVSAISCHPGTNAGQTVSHNGLISQLSIYHNHFCLSYQIYFWSSTLVVIILSFLICITSCQFLIYFGQNI